MCAAPICSSGVALALVTAPAAGEILTCLSHGSPTGRSNVDRAKLRPILRRGGVTVSDATVGRILAEVVKRGTVEPVKR